MLSPVSLESLESLTPPVTTVYRCLTQKSRLKLKGFRPSQIQADSSQQGVRRSY